MKIFTTKYEINSLKTIRIEAILPLKFILTY